MPQNNTSACARLKVVRHHQGNVEKFYCSNLTEGKPLVGWSALFVLFLLTLHHCDSLRLSSIKHFSLKNKAIQITNENTIIASIILILLIFTFFIKHMLFCALYFAWNWKNPDFRYRNNCLFRQLLFEHRTTIF